MQTIKKLTRANYTGDNVISEMTYTRGTWNKTHEVIATASESTRQSTGAIVLGNGVSRLDLHPNLLKLLKDHSDMKTYGCNAVLRDFTPDFAVASDDMVSEFVSNGYCDRTTVYASAQARDKYPDKFYYIPQNPNWNTGALAAYLACFDGHKTVYLMGHDLFTQEHNYQSNVYAGTEGYPEVHGLTTEGYFEKTMLMVMTVYNDVEFVRVGASDNQYMPESWKYLLNLRQITFREFVIETNLG